MKLLGIGSRFFGMKVVAITYKKVIVEDSNKKRWKYSFADVETNLESVTDV